LQRTLLPFLLLTLLIASAPACVKLPRRAALPRGDEAPTTQAAKLSAPPVSINRASREELERLPGVGPVLAARIVEHRERNGPFRKAEHLLVVRGMSERRFREIRALVTAE
jgi:competence ComEA-like helix-hairpin-helix protein